MKASLSHFFSNFYKPKISIETMPPLTRLAFFWACDPSWDPWSQILPISFKVLCIWIKFSECINSKLEEYLKIKSKDKSYSSLSGILNLLTTWAFEKILFSTPDEWKTLIILKVLLKIYKAFFITLSGFFSNTVKFQTSKIREICSFYQQNGIMKFLQIEKRFDDPLFSFPRKDFQKTSVAKKTEILCRLPKCGWRYWKGYFPAWIHHQPKLK